MEQRFYTSPMVEVFDMGGRPGGLGPAILQEPGIFPDTSIGSIGDEDYYVVVAEPHIWEEFDARYPNQDAQTGDPYKRRYPRKNIPSVGVINV